MVLAEQDAVAQQGPARRALSGLAPPASRALPLVTSFGQTFDPGASASPAGLAARARPEARLERRAANLDSYADRPALIRA